MVRSGAVEAGMSVVTAESCRSSSSGSCSGKGGGI